MKRRLTVPQKRRRVLAVYYALMLPFSAYNVIFQPHLWVAVLIVIIGGMTVARSLEVNVLEPWVADDGYDGDEERVIPEGDRDVG